MSSDTQYLLTHYAKYKLKLATEKHYRPENHTYYEMDGDESIVSFITPFWL